jgi:hypothetical protein
MHGKILIALLSICISTQAQIYTAVRVSPSTADLPTAGGKLYQVDCEGLDPIVTTMDWNTSYFNLSGEAPNLTLTYFGYLLNHYDVRWYPMPGGAAFTYETASSLTPLLPTGPLSGSSEPPTSANSVSVTPLQTFYFGVIYSATPFNGHPTEFEAIGWVGLQHDGFDLNMTSSAIARNVSGIHIGTLEVIPEPSFAALWALGLLLACRTRFRAFAMV